MSSSEPLARDSFSSDDFDRNADDKNFWLLGQSEQRNND